jgi:hypothetical protein|tara:strand:- start:7990 stop:8160 length:171 start_codon:yes stop_codon:yes gene_type:complete
MLLQLILVKLLEFKENIRRLSSCFRVVAENVNEVCEVAEEFNKSNSDESLNSQSSY